MEQLPLPKRPLNVAPLMKMSPFMVPIEVETDKKNILNNVLRSVELQDLRSRLLTRAVESESE